MSKHTEIWNIARKLKLGTEFYEGLDTLLTKIESDNQQLILQNVSTRCSDCLYKKYRPDAKHKHEINTCQITGLSISDAFNELDCTHFKRNEC